MNPLWFLDIYISHPENFNEAYPLALPGNPVTPISVIRSCLSCIIEWIAPVPLWMTHRISHWPFETDAKWALYCRWHFKFILPNEQFEFLLQYLKKKFLRVQLTITNRRQAVIWTNDYITYCCMPASLPSISSMSPQCCWDPLLSDIMVKMISSLLHMVHEDVIKWKHVPRYWDLCEGNLTGQQWIPLTKAVARCVMHSLICTWTNSWTLKAPVIWDAITPIMTSLLCLTLIIPLWHNIEDSAG